MKKEIESHQRFRGNIKTSTADAIQKQAMDKDSRIQIKSMQTS